MYEMDLFIRILLSLFSKKCDEVFYKNILGHM